MNLAQRDVIGVISMKGIGGLLVVLAGSVVGIFLIGLLIFSIDSFYAPKTEQVKERIWDETQMSIDASKEVINKGLIKYCKARDKGDTVAMVAAQSEIKAEAKKLRSLDMLGAKGSYLHDATAAVLSGSDIPCGGAVSL
jgi:hypothetical protein